jgi:hypothetical protein
MDNSMVDPAAAAASVQSGGNRIQKDMACDPRKAPSSYPFAFTVPTETTYVYWNSFSAMQLCDVLKKAAHSGASVRFAIHQPSSEIFNRFDRLVLINKGTGHVPGPRPEHPRLL